MKKARRASKYVLIGIVLTVFNYIIFSILARIISNNDLLWIDSIISYVAATFLAYLLHSKITWKERSPGKIGIIKFFAWNLITALAISPFFTWLFGYFTPIYQFAHQVSTFLHLPFDYEFVESTGIFCFVTLITMTLNYFFYDKLVFGKPKNANNENENIKDDQNNKTTTK